MANLPVKQVIASYAVAHRVLVHPEIIKGRGELIPRADSNLVNMQTSEKPVLANYVHDRGLSATEY